MWNRLRNYYHRDAGQILLGVLMLICLAGALPRVYATDEVQYYAWLRSAWFDHDVNFANEYTHFASMNPQAGIDKSLLMPNRIRPLTGLYGNIAPIGSALLWAPWFIATDAGLHGMHAVGLAKNIPADGYSWPYQRAVCYASAIYAMLGILIIRQLAQTWTSRWSSTLATFGIWLATPLIYYMTVQMPFAHANGFFVTCCFVWCWWQTILTPQRMSRWVLLGICAGMLYMVREQLILFMIMPAMSVGYIAWNALRARQFTPLRPYVATIMVCALVAGFTVAPQFLAYTLVNGVAKPASEVSSKLNLCSPHAVDTLIDFDPSPEPICNVGKEPVSITAWSRGALVWSPILLPAIIGLVGLARRHPRAGAPMLVAFLLQVWLNGAFGTTWHLSGAFGFRRFVECSPFFICGLAFLLDYLKTRIHPRVLIAGVVALIVWNMGLIVNATLFNSLTHIRRGLTWPDVWYWQWELPVRMWQKGADLFDRCRVLKNGCQ
jgi:hypothetical protein